MASANQYLLLLFNVNFQHREFYVKLKQYNIKKNKWLCFDYKKILHTQYKKKEVNFIAETLIFTLEFERTQVTYFFIDYKVKLKWVSKKN